MNPTKQHLLPTPIIDSDHESVHALIELGVTPIHRRSFSPVRRALNQ